MSRSRLAAGIGLVLAASATLHARPEPASRTALSPPAAVAARPAEGAPLPVFRLGTAARPFGWSTVVGDFNADGRPDVIVADRASQWTRGTGYRLDFAISGEAPASATLQSSEDAVGIRVADVDHDSDLDIVVASTTSGQTIAVWLNDGSGHFTPSSSPVPASATWTARTLDRNLPDGLVVTADVPSRRGAGVSAARARAPSPSTSSAALSPAAHPFASRLVLFSAAPRAPPASLTAIRS